MSFHVGPAGRQGLKVILLLARQVTVEEFALSTQYMAINKYYIRSVGASHFEWQSSRSPINLGELWWQDTRGRLMSESSRFLSKGCWPQSRIVYIIRGMGLDNRIWAMTLEFANLPPPPLFQVQPMLFVMKWMCYSWAEYPIKKIKKRSGINNTICKFKDPSLSG